MIKPLLFCFFVFLELAACAEATRYPSKYLGIFSLVDGAKNGTLKAFTSNYTGSYSNDKLNLTGYYKNGIPDSTWIAYFPYKVPEFVTVYENGRYRFMSYYPDGFPARCIVGTYQVQPNAFIHTPQQIYYWDPAGNPFSIDMLKPSPFELWGWGEHDQTLSSKQRDASGKIDTRVVSQIVSNDKVIIAVYFYTSSHFQKKDLFICRINQQTGELSIVNKQQESTHINVELTNKKTADNRIVATFHLSLKNPTRKAFIPDLNFQIEKRNHPISNSPLKNKPDGASRQGVGG